MTPSLQVKVLRALETGDILPVGADGPVARGRALHLRHQQGLGAMQQAGTFREDLYWRIKGVEVHLPPLRERTADLPLLARHFLNQCAHLCPDGRAKLLSDAATEALARARLARQPARAAPRDAARHGARPGDRREIQPEDLSFTGSERPAPPRPAATTLQQKVEALERREIEEALRRFNSNRTHTAEALGLSRQGLLKKLERYGLT